MITTEQELVDALMEDEAFRAEYQRHLLYALIHGRQGYGKNMSAKQKLMADISSLDNVKLNVGTLHGSRVAKLPQRVCNYRKPKVDWYGPKQWTAKDVYLKGRDPKDGLSVFSGKRFIAISEPAESEQFDQDYLKRFTGDEWVETKTYNSRAEAWKPQAELYIMSGKPLKINEKDEETIERVKRIEFREA